MKVKVSVIMPSLNMAEYIDECMESVLSQTLNDIEIICVDAGSTDGTWDKLSGYAEMDSRVRPVHSDVKSYGYQVNMGLDMASGEYVAILETDDFVDSRMYVALYDIARKYGVDYVKADWDWFVTGSDGIRQYTRSRLWNNHDGNDNYNRVIDPSVMEELYPNDYSIWKGIYSRRFLLYNDIRFNESAGAAFQDIGFMQQVLTYARRAYYSDESFYRYRMDREASSSYSCRTLQFAHQEYKWLMGNDRFMCNIRSSKGFYWRMVNVFRVELAKVLQAVGGDIRSEYIKGHYEWIRNVLVNNAGEYLEEFETMYPELKPMLEDLDGYAGQLKKTIRKRQVYRDIIHTADSDSCVVIFGAGKRGRTLATKLVDKGLNNVVFTDNNDKIWGNELDGIDVVSPEKAVREYGDGCFLIANKEHSEEIKVQLAGLGVDKEQILEDFGMVMGVI